MRTTLDIAKELNTQAKERRANPSKLWGLSWGFPGLDALTGGVEAKKLTVVGAEPGVGKSAFAGQVALNQARQLRDKKIPQVVRVVHREMDGGEFTDRLACHIAKVSARKIKNGTTTDEEWTRYKAALKEVAALPIEIEENPLSLDDTVSFIKGRTPDSLKCAWWMVDYLQIHPVRENERKTDPMEAVMTLTPAFRDLTKSVAPGMVLSQLTRAVSQRENHRPNMADLFGGRFVEANANLVLLIYREDLYMQLPEDKKHEPRFVELIVDKNRGGETGVVKMLFNPPFAEFRDISKREDNE